MRDTYGYHLVMCYQVVPTLKLVAQVASGQKATNTVTATRIIQRTKFPKDRGAKRESIKCVLYTTAAEDSKNIHA